MEFLIRTRDDHEWPVVAADRVAVVLTPRGWDCAVCPGLGDFGLRCGGSEIAFSAEMAGWQVSVDGSMSPEMALRFIQEVAGQVEREVGVPVEWIQLT
jgi:hypothetical protein